jgi:anti-sigma B factor antagonist
MSSELGFREERCDNSTVIYLSGELDIYTSQKFKEKLYGIADSTDTDILINCKDLNYIDSTGLGIFVGALKRAKQRDKGISLCSLRENVKKLFIITGLERIFTIKE